MNLSHEQRHALNAFLCRKELDIPRERRYVSEHGTNYQWLRKHLLVRNPQIPKTIRELLNL